MSQKFISKHSVPMTWHSMFYIYFYIANIGQIQRKCFEWWRIFVRTCTNVCKSEFHKLFCLRGIGPNNSHAYVCTHISKFKFNQPRTVDRENFRTWITTDKSSHWLPKFFSLDIIFFIFNRLILQISSTISMSYLQLNWTLINIVISCVKII
jgi:hypothetical protein